MKRLIRLAITAVLSAFVLANGLAFMQARAMTHFVESGNRTGKPEQLSVLDKFTVLFAGVTIPRPVNRRSPADLNLSYELHRIPSAQRNILDAWLIPGTNDGAMVAMFHGYAATKSTLLSAAREFHQLGYPVLLVDFYGSGGSSGSGTTVGVRESDDVAAVVEYARRKWPERKIVLYGFSMGGSAVLRAIAVNGVEAAGVIVEASFDRLLNTARARFAAMGFSATPFAELLLFWGGIQNGFNPFAHNPVDYARSVKLPVLILHGGADRRVTVDQARNVAAALDGNGRLIVYDETPHTPIVEAKREEWIRDVGQFLGSLN